MLIRIFSPASVLQAGQPVTDSATIRAIVAAESDEVCSEYLPYIFADLGVIGGTVKLVHDSAAGQFRVVTEFAAPDKLNDADLAQLVEEARGQWSDGIGEHCFDEVIRQHELSIDLTPSRVVVRTEQIDDGRVIPRPPAALFQAARDGRTADLKQLLDAGGQIESRQRGRTLLHLAVSGGQAEAALELIRRGADIAARSNDGDDALMLTAISNRIDDDSAALVARALLDRAAALKLPNGLKINEKRTSYTPLFMALNRNKTKLIDVFRQFGATEALNAK